MATLQDVSAVLITKHPEYPSDISLEGFGEVIVKTNSPNVYERYAQAANAKHDIIYVQDDDCIIDYKTLFSKYNGRITNSMPAGRNNFYKKISGGRITLVGWGAFFPKHMLASFERYTSAYGRDFNFYREADRIFTWLNHPHNTIILPHIDLERFVAGDRMHADPKHFEYVNEVMRKLDKIAPRRDIPHLLNKLFGRN